MPSSKLYPKLPSNWYQIFHEIAHYADGIIFVAPPASGKSWLVSKISEQANYNIFDFNMYGRWDHSSILAPQFVVGLDLLYHSRAKLSTGIDARIANHFLGKNDQTFNDKGFEGYFSTEKYSDELVFDTFEIKPISSQKRPRLFLLVTYVYVNDRDEMSEMIAHNLKSRYTILSPYSIPRMEYSMYPSYNIMIEHCLGIYDNLPKFYMTYDSIFRYIQEVY
jgi:hypothetical protein